MMITRRAFARPVGAADVRMRRGPGQGVVRLISWSLAGLARGSTGLAPVGLALLAGVVLAIPARFGWTFLGGATLIGLVDLGMITWLTLQAPAR